MATPHVTIMIHRDGALESRTIRIPLWSVRAGLIAATVLAAALLLGLALYLPIVRAAARVPSLEREVARLEAERAKVQELAAALDSVESRYAQLRKLIGADIVPDPALLAPPLAVAPAIRARVAGWPAYEQGPSRPTHWPLQEAGYVTRRYGESGDTADGTHPGIDVAIGVGTPVRAAGGGTVVEARSDREYGLMIRLQHPEGYESVYGHLSRLLAEEGQQVNAGEVIGLAGNTGNSSAPHLHFELRREGKSIDPLTLVKEGR
ncbi:MAG: M23 family metallopeptidase [Gemmatimonadota bacterium]